MELILPGEAFSHEATSQVTQNSTDINITHNTVDQFVNQSVSQSVRAVLMVGVPLFSTAPGGEPLLSHFI